MRLSEEEHVTTEDTGLRKYCLEHSSSTATVIVTIPNTVIPVNTVDPWRGEDDLEASLVPMKTRAVIFRVLI